MAITFQTGSPQLQLQLQVKEPNGRSHVSRQRPRSCWKPNGVHPSSYLNSARHRCITKESAELHSRTDFQPRFDASDAQRIIVATGHLGKKKKVWMMEAPMLRRVASTRQEFELSQISNPSSHTTLTSKSDNFCLRTRLKEAHMRNYESRTRQRQSFPLETRRIDDGDVD